jgi:hypothetical protein
MASRQKCLSINVAKAISKGKFQDLRSSGVTKGNVNEKVVFFLIPQICPGQVLKVRVSGGTPFIDTIAEPIPLVYAILCEQTDTVLYLMRHFGARLDVAIDGVCLGLTGTRSTLQPQSKTTTFC